MNFERAISILEFDKIREMLADLALCESAADMALRLSPDDDLQHIKRRLKETSDAKTLAGSKGAPSFWGVKDITGCLDRDILHTHQRRSVAACNQSVARHGQKAPEHR